jgi:phosphoadenosine phosphosulfate reductase
LVTLTTPISASDLLAWAAGQFGPSLALSTSFQKEGMILVDMAARVAPGIRVFTLDTGRLPEETYQMIGTVRARYGMQVELVAPDPQEVAAMVALHGPNLFYREVPLRMLCCQVRKVRPLERRVASVEAWITGLRREQAASRADVRQVEDDARPVKINPLADWTQQQVDDYIRAHDVPLHPLYARGYSSIGCSPCTRAGEGRSGRWWWEEDADKECGIHFSPDGKAERNVDVLLREIKNQKSPGAGADHPGFTLWFTGLSGAGKSTISAIIEHRLRAAGARVEVLDGDVVRTHLSKGLGFSREDRDTNIRRIGFVAEMLSRHGVIAIVAAISPYREVRDEVRGRIENFVEVYVECPIEVLARRDVKGLYEKALAGEIPAFTGVSDPYEPPLHPDVVVNSSLETPEQSADKIWATLENKGLIQSPLRLAAD